MDVVKQGDHSKGKVESHRQVVIKNESDQTGDEEKNGTSSLPFHLHDPPTIRMSWDTSNVKEGTSTPIAAPPQPMTTAPYHHLPDIPDELEKIYRKVYAPRKTPTSNTSKPKYPQNNMPDFPYIFPPNHVKKKLPLPTLKQVQKAIPPKASSVFHVLDRRINFDSFSPDASLYSLLRAWVKDDPYLAKNQFDLFQHVSLPSQRRDVNSHKIGTGSYYPTNRKKLKMAGATGCDMLSIIKENNKSTPSQENSYGRYELLAEHITHAIHIRKKYRRDLTKDCKEIEKSDFFKDLLPIKGLRCKEIISKK